MKETHKTKIQKITPIVYPNLISSDIIVIVQT